MDETSWRLTFRNDINSCSRQHVMNHLIFDFEKYDFNVRRKESWGGVEYQVELSDLMADVEPFYHAAALHRMGSAERAEGSIRLKSFGNGGMDSPFLDVAGAPSKIRVKPTKRGNGRWDVRVEWTASLVPIIL
jgi:hypothetical protein